VVGFGTEGIPWEDESSRGMQKKYITAAYASLVGLLGAASVRAWPSHASQLQMAMYTLAIIGLLAIGFWSDRGRPRIRAAAAATLILHLTFLFAIRQVFPFKTILAVIPYAIIEGIGLR
jgi:hypothetical protein